jgi:chromosome segregation ATPase
MMEGKSNILDEEFRIKREAIVKLQKEITEANIHIKNLVSALAEERRKNSVLSISLEDTKRQLNLLMKQKQEIVDMKNVSQDEQIHRISEKCKEHLVEKDCIIGKLILEIQFYDEQLAEKDKELTKEKESRAYYADQLAIVQKEIAELKETIKWRDELVDNQADEIARLKSENKRLTDLVHPSGRNLTILQLRQQIDKLKSEKDRIPFEKRSSNPKNEGRT